MTTDSNSKALAQSFSHARLSLCYVAVRTLGTGSAWQIVQHWVWITGQQQGL
jgi:hypothetical protein